jgi:serine/threonine protein kinase
MSKQEIKVNREPIDGYSFISFIGGGSFGKVYKATKDNSVFALKCLNYITAKNKTDADQEVHNLIMLKGACPYIIDFLKSFEHNDEKWIVMEYCEFGTLSEEIDLMKKRHFTKVEDEIWKIIAQFLIALFVMNEKGIAHRDIKDQNIFLDDYSNIKIGFEISEFSLFFFFIGDLGTAKEASFDSMAYGTLAGTEFV